VQRKLTVTLGKRSIVIPPELNEKLQTDSALRQIESERKRKLSREQFNAELLAQARIEYLMTREKILSTLNALQ